MTILYVMSALIAVVMAAPFLAERLRIPMNKARQDKAPGNIAALEDGNTHYRWRGPDHAPVVVCIHGLSTPSYIFAATERSLVKLGYRVLAYDLYGRGYSDRLAGAQNIDFFLSQLDALLLEQAVHGPFTVVGFSMGGQIAAAFAARTPERVSRLILVAPSGLHTVPERDVWTMPLIGDWLTRLWGGRKLRSELIEHRTIATAIPDLEDRQAAETRMRGFLPAVLSSRRNVLAKPSAEDHRKIADHGTPVLAIWGDEDPVIPLSSIGKLAALNPDAHHVQISSAGHSLLQTHPAQVSEALRKFLQD